MDDHDQVLDEHTEVLVADLLDKSTPTLHPFEAGEFERSQRDVVELLSEGRTAFLRSSGLSVRHEADVEDVVPMGATVFDREEQQ